MTPRPTWSASGAAGRRRPRRPAGGLGRGRRRDLRHRLRGRAARARRRPRSRRSTAAARRSSPATSPPGSTPPAARSRALAVEAAITVSFHARQARPPGRPRQVAHRRAAGRADRDPRRRPRRAARPGRSTPRCSAWRRAAAPRSTKFSSGQVAIAGGSRGLTGAVRMSSLAAIRAGAGYATVAVPADLEPIFEQAQPEVMSVGCPGGDGCLAPGSAKAVLRAFERAAAGVLGPGLGRDPGSVELAREVVRQIEAPLVLDADGLNAFAERLGWIAARRGADGPHPARRRAGPPARPRLGGDRRPPPRLRPARPRAPPARSSSSRATTRSSPTASGSRSTSLSAPALATAGTGDVLSGHRRGAARPRPRALRRRLRRRSSPTPAPGARPRGGSAPPSR